MTSEISQNVTNWYSYQPTTNISSLVEQVTPKVLCSDIDKCTKWGLLYGAADNSNGASKFCLKWLAELRKS